MATAGTRRTDDRDRAGRTLAQTFCLAFGLTLIAVGILGFIASSSFSTGNNPAGSDFILFKVNAWHNIVHIASGAFLLACAARGPLAATGATAFGVIYGIVTVYGLIDGNDVLHLIPVDTADNILHIALTLLALAVGLTSGGLMASSRNTRGRGAQPAV